MCVCVCVCVCVGGGGGGGGDRVVGWGSGWGKTGRDFMIHNHTIQPLYS